MVVCGLGGRGRGLGGGLYRWDSTSHLQTHDMRLCGI